MTAALALTDVAIGHTSTAIVTDINLEVSAGEIIALVGPSGSGKSTLLSTIAGILPALAGRIDVDGTDATSLPVHERKVGLVFQEPLLFPHMTVLDNIAYGLRRQGQPRHQARERAAELLDWVGLAGLDARRPDHLSGGQAQRVALARSLAPAPRVLLLDEPFSALDTDLRQHLATEVAALLRAREVAAVHVTHDLDEARTIGDRVVSLDEISRRPA